MKLRILNFGVPVTHDSMSEMVSFLDAVAISDFDAFVFDPSAFVKEIAKYGSGGPRLYTVEDSSGVFRSRLKQHRAEISDLVREKGGVVICLLRPNDVTLRTYHKSGSTTYHDDHGTYFLIEQLVTTGRDSPISYISSGSGENIRPSADTKLGRIPYLAILAKSLKFFASFHNKASEFGEVAASDSVGHPVAMELKIGRGRVLFLPHPFNVPGDRFGAAIAQTVRSRMEVETETFVPDWAKEIIVPGSNMHVERIGEIELSAASLQQELDRLKKERADLLNHRQLLFATGKQILEPAVRRAFRTLGMIVTEPEQYSGEWDLSMVDLEELYYIGEIEGSEGAIDVGKYRQLLDYVNDEVLQGREPKGILVGNGYRNEDPESREEQFTDHVLRGAARMNFCLLPTTELFGAVCAVIDSKDAETLKASIRNSIHNCTGVWRFSRPITREAETLDFAAAAFPKGN